MIHQPHRCEQKNFNSITRVSSAFISFDNIHHSSVHNIDYHLKSWKLPFPSLVIPVSRLSLLSRLFRIIQISSSSWYPIIMAARPFKPSNPPPVGRLSLLGAIMTLLEICHKGSMFFGLPVLLVLSHFCESEECRFPFDLHNACVISSQIPSWILWWWMTEFVFYVAMHAKLKYLQSVDPQESYFKAANIQSKQDNNNNHTKPN